MGRGKRWARRSDPSEQCWQQAASYHRATRASLLLFYLSLLQGEVLSEVVLNGGDDRLDKFEENDEVLMNSKLPSSFRNLV